MADLHFISEDRRFEIRIGGEQVDEMVRFCVESGKHETGGVIAGKYDDSHKCARIINVSDAPADSRRGRFTFVRGVRGLQGWLNLLWSKQQGYYLGEWHFHPFAPPEPSSTDLRQMQKVAEDDGHHCPEPIMLILGGNPNGSWTIRAFIFPRGKPWQELHASSVSIIAGRLSPKTL
jgi:integrative and conjugative element protein (TIGR02256 family)